VQNGGQYCNKIVFVGKLRRFWRFQVSLPRGYLEDCQNIDRVGSLVFRVVVEGFYLPA
jgi:hypothetical protein